MPEDVKVSHRFNPQKGGEEGGVTNAERAEKAFRLLGTVPRGGEHDEYLERLAPKPEECLIDLLADLLHLCDREEWDFDQAMARARKYHAEER